MAVKSYETDIMECERAPRLHPERVSGFFRGGGCGYFVPAGDEAAGRAD